MRARLICLLAAIVIITGGFFSVFFLLDAQTSAVDIAAINDIAMSCAKKFEAGESFSNVNAHDYEFTVISADGEVLYSNGSKASENVIEALKKGDIVYDIEKGGNYYGKILVYRDKSAEDESRVNSIVCISVTIFLTATICVSYFLFLRKAVFIPFKKMEGFAKSVAMGQLDIPIEMDKNNIFGAFTESFDIMREELEAARVREAEAEKSKREIVAQLSHDIKTPVSSIMAVAELLSARAEISGNDYEIRQLSVITSKVEQINQLITNIFHAALEELDRLPVNISEEESSVISTIISESDYENRIGKYEIDGCIIRCDTLRLRQVFDNIIGNSYKYAGTDIEIKSEISDGYLNVTVRDFGGGVSCEDSSRLFIKYYRGENSEGKSGSGLGLYISRYLMEKMDGKIEYTACEKGFAVKISICLA